MADNNETCEQLCDYIDTRIDELWDDGFGCMENGEVDELNKRWLAAHRREVDELKKAYDHAVAADVRHSVEAERLVRGVEELATAIRRLAEDACGHCDARYCEGDGGQERMPCRVVRESLQVADTYCPPPPPPPESDDGMPF